MSHWPLRDLVYSEPNPLQDPLAHEVFNELLGLLTHRQRDIIQRRFLHGESYETIAKAFCVTRERIRQIESKALMRLRHPTRIKPLTELMYGTVQDPDLKNPTLTAERYLKANPQPGKPPPARQPRHSYEPPQEPKKEELPPDFFAPPQRRFPTLAYCVFCSTKNDLNQGDISFHTSRIYFACHSCHKLNAIVL